MAHEVLNEYYLNGTVVYIDDTIIYGRNEEMYLILLDFVEVSEIQRQAQTIQVLLWHGSY